LGSGLVVGGLVVGTWRVGRAADASDTADVDPADDAAEGDAAAADDGEGEGGIGFPSDRLRERQLDRGRRLVADQRWSDAATLFDEILAADNDCFFRADQQQRTWQSIKSETSRLIGTLDKPGREA
jgi:hypothetical protein